MVAISEVKACLPEADPHHRSDHPQGAARSRSAARRSRRSGRLPVRFTDCWLDSRALVSCWRPCASFARPGTAAIDTYSPFPIHGMERALRLSPLHGSPRSSWRAGRSACSSPSIVQYYESTVSYPLVVDGKPFNSAEAFVPISFETMILYAAIGAVLGMLFLNGLPRFYHPVFRGRTFARASDDGFFLSVESRDAMFDKGATPELLADAGRGGDPVPESLRIEKDESARSPRRSRYPRENVQFLVL